jgi:membrane protein
METEVHVYAFSMAANVLLSLFPFFIVMVSICRYILHWNAAEEAIYLALRDLFPGAIGQFIPANLVRVLGRDGAPQITSLFLLMFTANGVFEPLEVALNKAWGIPKNRTFVRNQLVSMGLILLCGGLTFISYLMAALNIQMLKSLGIANTFGAWFALAVLKMVAIPLSIVALFLVYWRLPNGRVPARRLIPVSIAVGAILESLKYVSMLVGPALSRKLDREYGPFEYSVTIILWSFIASMIVLAGADYAARAARERPGLQRTAPVVTVEEENPANVQPQPQQQQQP